MAEGRSSPKVLEPFLLESFTNNIRFGLEEKRESIILHQRVLA